MNIQYQSTVTSYKRNSDKSVSVTTRSNYEMSPEDLLEIDKIHKQEAWTLIAPNELTDIDIPSEPATSEGGKTKLQRMRAVYFLLWRDKTDQGEPFNTYWDRQFEKILDKLKERLD